MKRIISLFALAIFAFIMTSCTIINDSGLKFDLEEGEKLVGYYKGKDLMGQTLYDVLEGVSVEKEGYTFTGWWLEGNGLVEDDGQLIERNSTVSPVFKANEYKVTLEYNNGDESEVKTVTFDSEVNLENPESYDRYMKFDKWYVDAELTQEWDGKVPACDFNLYASYREYSDSVMMFYYNGELVYKYLFVDGDTFDLANVPTDFYLEDYENTELLTLEWYAEDGTWVNENYEPAYGVVNIEANIYSNILNYKALTDETGNETGEARVISNAALTYNGKDEAGNKIVTPYKQIYIAQYIKGYKVVEVGSLTGYGIPSASYQSTEAQKEAYAMSINAVLEKVYIPATVKSINEGALKYAEALISVTFEEGSVLESIGNQSFAGCISLENIQLPNTVKNIGNEYYKINSLTESYSTVKVTEGAFAGCVSLKEFDFPENLEKLTDFAFANCYALTNVELPETLKLLGVGVFYNAFVESEDVVTTITIKSSYDKLFYAQNTLDGTYEYYDQHTNPFYSCNVNEIYFEGLTAIPDLKNLRIGSTATSATANLTIAVPQESMLYNYFVNHSYKYAYPFFFNCNNLTKVSFDKSIQCIGSYAFFGLSNVEVEIPIDVEEVKYGEGVFANTTYGGEFTLPDNMYDVPDYAFANSDIVKFTNTVPMYETIGEYAFWNCENLVEFKISSFVEYIASTAFKNCTKLGETGAFKIDNEEFTLVFENETPTLLVGNGGTTILYDFAPNIEVKSFPEGVTSIPALYSGNKNIKTVYIPSTVKTIEQEAFSGCTSLETIIYAPNSQLESIQTGAFKGCTKLSYAYYEGSTETNVFMIPKSVKVIGYSVEELEEYRKMENYAEYLSDSKNSSYTNAVFYNAGTVDIVFEEGTAIEFISYGAFYRSSSTTKAIESVTFPETATTTGLVISAQAFYTKTSTAVSIFNVPEYAIYIGSKACYGWDGVVLPENGQFTVLGGVFAGINNTSFEIIIPDYIEEIEDDAFAGTKVKSISFAEGSNLKVLNVISSSSASTITTLDFSNCLNIESIANKCLAKVSATNVIFNAKMFAEGVVQSEEEEVLSLGGSTFGATGLKVTINAVEENGENVKYYLDSLFASSKLATITLGEGLVSVGDEGFKGTSIVSVTFPASLESLGEYVFSTCTKLTKVTFNSSVEFKEGMFFKCTALSSFTIPEGVTHVPNSMFYGCTALTKVTLPNTIEEIGHFAFMNCSKLATINTNNTLPTSLVKVGDKAFYKAQALDGKTITFPETLEEIGILAFNLAGSSDAKSKVYSAKLVFTNEGGVDALRLGQYALENNDFVDSEGFAIYKTSYTADVTSFANIDYNKEYEYVDYVEVVLTYYSGGATANIPDGVTMIDDATFLDSTVTSIVFPSTLKEIAKGSISAPSMKTSDNKLSSVVFDNGRSENSTLTIGDYAFYDMPLATLEFPTEGEVILGSGSFRAASKASKNAMQELDLYLPGNLVLTNTSIFMNQFNLKSVTFGEGITELGSQIFDINGAVSGATLSIASVTLPSTLVKVNSKTFNGWGALKEVNFTAKADGTYEFTTFGTAWLMGTLVENIVIPSSVTEISSNAFEGMTHLKEVIIPSSVVSIGGYAFKNTAITELVIPSSVETLGSNMFNGCSNLTTVIIGSETEPSKLIEIPSLCFANATALKTVVIYSETFLTHKGTSASAGACYKNNSTVLYVSSSVLEEYINDSKWALANCTFEDISNYNA